MKTIPYPTSITNKAFIQAIDYLNSHKECRKYSEFDYPDYAGLPKEISHKLYSDEVDYIQDLWNNQL